MIDITHKNYTLRTAVAQAVVEVGHEETIEKLENLSIPKGNVLESARIAALFAAKKTSEIIPDCHPLPIESAVVHFEIVGLEIFITVTIKTIYKTGVEVEAMHAASVAALTMYDMLKPIDKHIIIHSIKLLEKQGGKSQYKDQAAAYINTAVLVISDSIAAGKKHDSSGKIIIDKLLAHQVQTHHYDIIPDGIVPIREKIQEYLELDMKLIILTGGTGLSPRDYTPEAIAPLLDREIPGIGEYLRAYGQQRMPYAMLSRSIAGLIGDTLIITLPGSTRGAAESIDALFPHILHIFKMIQGGKH